MPVIVDGKEHTLRQSTFIWGFDNKQKQCIRPALFPIDNPIARNASELLREIARCGWDIPEIDIKFSTAESRSGQLFTFVSSITVPFNKTRQELRFDVSLNAACDGVSTNFVDYFHEVGSDTTHFGDKLAANSEEVTFFTAMIDRTMALLASKPTAEGHTDYTAQGDANLRRLLHVTPIPAPHISPTLYARISAHQLERRAKDGSHRLFGPRLLPLSGSITKDGLHARAFDSFTYATANPERAAGNGIHTPSGDELVVEIKLSDLNEVYVIDGARRMETEMAYQELLANTGRDYLHPEEAEEIFTATARTMTPITEYRGGFQEPTYLIGRCLLKEEARLVTGPTEVLRSDDGIDVKLIDNKTGRKITLHKYTNTTPITMENAASLANRVAAELSTQAIVPKSMIAEINADKRKRYTSFVEGQLKSGERSEIMELLMQPSTR
jgi:hypothetical protein